MRIRQQLPVSNSQVQLAQVDILAGGRVGCNRADP